MFNTYIEQWQSFELCYYGYINKGVLLSHGFEFKK